MPRITKTEWTCDLCKVSTTKEGENPPHKWVVLPVEDRFCERLFTDKVICPTCVETILKRMT